MYVYMFVCMVFANIWRFKALSESKVVPYYSHVNSTLLRHETIGMWQVSNERVARDRNFHSSAMRRNAVYVGLFFGILMTCTLR